MSLKFDLSYMLHELAFTVKNGVYDRASYRRQMCLKPLKIDKIRVLIARKLMSIADRLDGDYV